MGTRETNELVAEYKKMARARTVCRLWVELARDGYAREWKCVEELIRRGFGRRKEG